MTEAYLQIESETYTALAREVSRLREEKRELMEALTAHHKAADWLMAQLIGKDVTFMPTKSPVWDAIKNTHALLARVNAKEKI